MKRILLGILIIAIVAAGFGGFLLASQPEETEELHMRIRSDREIFVEYNRPYVEVGAYAEFQKGEDIQPVPVQIGGDTVDTGKLGTYLVEYTAVYEDYTVTDYRKVHVVDTEQPEVQLLGAQYYILNVDQPYVEPGCTATDNYDGDLSAKISISGEVDIHTPGEYDLTYTVTDSYNNTASIQRIVRVEEWDFSQADRPVVGEPNGKVIYLTFDDGPSKHTNRLLDVLKKYDVKATFFVVKTEFSDIIKRIAAEGHTVAMHTTSHVYKKVYASEEAYFKDLHSIQKLIKDLTGQESKFLRFPGGSSNKASSFNPGIMTRLTKLVEEKGFRYFDWTIDSKDTGGAKTPLAVCQNVISGILNEKREYSIVLQHDIKGYSVDAVEAIIRWGLENGYTFLPIDENTPQYHHTVRN